MKLKLYYHNNLDTFSKLKHYKDDVNLGEFYHLVICEPSGEVYYI